MWRLFIRWVCVIGLCALILYTSFFVHAAEVCMGSVNEAWERLGRHDIDTLFIGNRVGTWTLWQDSIINLLVNKREQSRQRKGLIFHFCDTVLQSRRDVERSEARTACFDHGNFRYDPRQSLFVYALCVHTDEQTSSDWIEQYTLRDTAITTYKDLFANIQYAEATASYNLGTYIRDDTSLADIRWLPALQEGEEHLCDPRYPMQWCEFSSFVPTIFRTVMSLYTDMKLATIYGYKYLQSDAPEEDKKEQIAQAIAEFSDTYFAPSSWYKETSAYSECGDVKTKYLSEDKLTWEQSHCSHPKTYAYLAKYIQSSHKLIEDIPYIDAEALLAQNCTQMSSPKDNLQACAFSNFGEIFYESDRSVFQNLYANELMWYALFTTYYADQIADDVTYSPIRMGRYTFTAQRHKQESDHIIKELALHKEAAYQMNRLLSQLYVSFPLHIALSAYTEDLKAYRKNLKSLYSPLHQVNFLWRNAQSCQE